MPLSPLHLAKQARRAVVLTGCVAVMAMTGCQSLTSASSLARVRVVDLSADAPAVDVYHGSNAVAYNLSFGAVTSYVPVTPGAYTLTVDPAGSKQVLSSLKGSFAAGGQYTLLVSNSAASLQQVMLTDQPQQLAPAAPSIRLVHQSAHTGAVDVYLVAAGQRLSATSPLVEGLASGAATGYLPLPVGTFSVVMLPAGTPPTASAAIHSGRQLRYSSGVARTLILVDAQPSSSSDVQVIMATDVEPAS